MYQFDKWIIDFIIKYLPHSYSFYKVALFISGENLLKGGMVALMMWYLWFKNTDTLSEKRVHIIATIFSSFVTIIVSRVITLVTPFQSRPMLNPELTYFRFDTDNTSIDEMSSFPSDHAALFISLAAGLVFVSKRVGIFALLYASLFILFPRIYLGYHYPSDIFAGALIGVVVTIFCNKSIFITTLISTNVIPFSKKRAQWFYPIFFLLTFQIVVLFNDFRRIIMFIGYNKW
jgi:undecaprenyl-diphosphatase